MVFLSSLNRLRPLRLAVTGARRRWLGWRHGVRIGATTSISLSARFVGAGRGSIHIGENSLIAFKTLLLADRDADGTVRPVVVGERCFIGGGSMLLPGVTIGDGCVVGAGAVVAHSVPPGCIVAGNPARIIRRDVRVGRFGRLEGADEGAFSRRREAHGGA